MPNPPPKPPVQRLWSKCRWERRRISQGVRPAMMHGLRKTNEKILSWTPWISKGLLFTETGSLKEFENATVSGARRFGPKNFECPGSLNKKVLFEPCGVHLKSSDLSIREISAANSDGRFMPKRRGAPWKSPELWAEFHPPSSEPAPCDSSRKYQSHRGKDPPYICIRECEPPCQPNGDRPPDNCQRHRKNRPPETRKDPKSHIPVRNPKEAAAQTYGDGRGH